MASIDDGSTASTENVEDKKLDEPVRILFNPSQHELDPPVLALIVGGGAKRRHVAGKMVSQRDLHPPLGRYIASLTPTSMRTGVTLTHHCSYHHNE